MLAKALLNLDQVARILDPGIRIDSIVESHAAAVMRDRMLDAARPAKVMRSALDAAAFAEAVRSPGSEATADLLHLVQNPVIRDAFSPPPGQEDIIDAARSPDRDAIDALVAATDGDSAASWLDAWWQRHQRAFRTLRAADRSVRGVQLTPLSSSDRIVSVTSSHIR